MLNTAAKLKLFFSGFNLPAYTLESVPDEVILPYITYQLIEPEWDQQADGYCQVWYPKNRLSDLLAKADEIAGEIGLMKKLDHPGGYLILRLGTPAIQIMNDEYSQYAYIKLTINAYHMPGD